MDKEIKQCQNCKQNFVIESKDFEFYEKIKVPAPTFCPECREQRRIAFRNERALYKRKCDLCGEVVISRVSPNKPYKMYCKKCWWSDNWDLLEYGRDYDFSRPFFEQYKDLLLSTPHISILNGNVVNSEWVNQETDDKNCYLNVGGHYNEDSAYNTYEFKSANCFDNFWVFGCDLCYENLNCERCYKTLFSRECFDCQETFLSYDCKNCSNVFGCVGLRNRKYCIFNQQVSKEEYFEFLKNNLLSSRKNVLDLKERAERNWFSVPHKYAAILKSYNATGHFITESKNLYNCWYSEKSEDCKNLYLALSLKDVYDASSFGWGELCYEAGHCGGVYGSKFFLYIFGGGGDVTGRNSSNIEYCYATPASNNCFGCANIKKGEYCILNKQYSPESYKETVERIKEHMNTMPYIDKKGRVYKYGEFFPIELSPFGYNETAAMDYFPLTKEKALENGYPWSDYESQSQYQISDYEIPDDIKDVKDDILEKILKCEVSGKPYKIISMELDFYRKLGLPIPRRAPLQRHKDRIAKLLPRRFYKRKCMCNQQSTTNNQQQAKYQNTIQHFHGKDHCSNEIDTPYAPDRPEIVYCAECYQQEIV